MRLITRYRKQDSKHGYKIICNVCEYNWFPRLKTPVFCPCCNSRLDNAIYINYKVDIKEYQKPKSRGVRI